MWKAIYFNKNSETLSLPLHIRHLPSIESFKLAQQKNVQRTLLLTPINKAVNSSDYS